MEDPERWSEEPGVDPGWLTSSRGLPTNGGNGARYGARRRPLPRRVRIAILRLPTAWPLRPRCSRFRFSPVSTAGRASTTCVRRGKARPINAPRSLPEASSRLPPNGDREPTTQNVSADLLGAERRFPYCRRLAPTLHSVLRRGPEEIRQSRGRARSCRGGVGTAPFQSRADCRDD